MKNKLALLYTFWTGDDVDMLIRSIEQHKEHVDMIVVDFQIVSNKGETDNKISLDRIRLKKAVMDLDSKGVLISFEPNLSLSTKQNERNKHNDMIEVAKHSGCTHFILSAADHFYSKEMFDYGKEVMQTTDTDVILTRMRTYYKQDNWILDPIEEYYMPFIHKLTVNTEITTRVKYPVVVDPSVKVSTAQKFHIASDEYLMDHYSMVRMDIEKKFRNAASSIRWTKEDVQTFINEYQNAKVGDSIKYFQGRKIVEYTKDSILES